MFDFKHVAVTVILVSVPNLMSYAADQRCSVPPYGDSIVAYRAFVNNFEGFIVPAPFLSKICNVKYGGADRVAFYNLGFTDQYIDSKSTTDLGADMILATKRFLDKTGK